MISSKIQLFIGLFFFLMASSFQAQVIINEISYNPPESNVDSLEYIELLNAGNGVVNIEGWHFSKGVEDTFPNIDLQPGDYFVTAINAQAMLNVYGVVVHQWTDGAANNSGEAFVLLDASNNLVDSVLFDDADPWPLEPDGTGPSLELIDSSLDNNDGVNWQFSGGNTGVIINGFEVSGTPGAENSGGGTPGPAVTINVINFRFDAENVVVKVGDVVRWVSNTSTPHNVDGLQDIFPSNPVAFSSGFPVAGPWQFDLTFTEPGLYHYQCDLHGIDGMVGTVSVYDPNAYTDFPLEHLRLTNVDGSHIFDGVPTTVTATVHGINFQPTGYSFYIINQNNTGINVFSFDPGSYTVTEGDQVKVSGVIDQFNGLLEIIPDTIEVLSTGNEWTPPVLIDQVTEEVEGSHIAFLVYAIDSIVATGVSGYNVFVTHEHGAKALIRVDADSGFDLQFIEISNAVRGIGTQFDSSFPFTSGYQILALELQIVSGIPIIPDGDITMKPNPAKNILLINSEINLSGIEIYALDGRRLMQQQLNGVLQAELNISNLPVGLHAVKAITDQGIWTSLLSVIR